MKCLHIITPVKDSIDSTLETMRAVLDSAGVTDVLAKSKGSSNPHNLVKATIEALSQIRDAYTIAGTRGITMDKVFNG